MNQESLKSIRLTFTEGSSDKEYNAQIVKDGSGYQVHFQYGRRNGTLQSGSKTQEPVDLDSAEKIYNKMVKEKTSKGYQVDGTSKSTFQTVAKEESGTIPQLLNPIDESELNNLTRNSSFVFQKKYDGERRLVFKTANSCHGGNRKGQMVSLPSEVVDSLVNESDIELDGEIIGNTLYVFDLLKHNGKDYKVLPLSKRLSALSEIKFGSNIVIAPTAVSENQKKELLNKLKEDGAEGIVIKDASAKYTSSRPASGGTALKFKFYKTATVKVTAQTKGKRSVKVSVLEGTSFMDVGAVTIPPNYEVPSVGDLVEVRYLYAYKGGSLYQPTYLGVRKDLDESEAHINQLEYKQE
jgi:bifunctional non-homologous end joining protein LigD